VHLRSDDQAGTSGSTDGGALAGVRDATRRLATQALRAVEQVARATVWREPDAVPGLTSREMLAALDAGGVAVAVLDDRGTVRFASRSAARLLGDASGAAPAWTAVRAAVVDAGRATVFAREPIAREMAIGGERYRLVLTSLDAGAADLASRTAVVIVRAGEVGVADARAPLGGRAIAVADLPARARPSADVAPPTLRIVR